MILGIDFGTNNSCVSVFKDNNVIVIPNELGNYTTPSCIFFSPDSDEILYGQNALNLLLSNNNKSYL